jgi:hypothetical protein
MKAYPEKMEANKEETKRKSLKKRQQWTLSEHWKTDMGTGI